MRTAITVAVQHDQSVLFLSDTTVPIEEQKAQVKKLKSLREHPEYSEVQLWESGSGITSRVKFQKPKEAASPTPPADMKDEDAKTPPTPPADTKRKK